MNKKKKKVFVGLQRALISTADMQKRRKKKNHDDGTAIIDLRLDAADNEPDVDTGGARGEGRIVFSFSSDAEPDELWCDVDRSTFEEDAVAVASFAWRISSVPDIEIGRRVLAIAGGDLVPGRPTAEEIDDTRV
jgi:hypothetical protein